MIKLTLDKLIAITAFIIAAAAAYFSVTGIGKLFAGAMISAMVMAGALELGKLVSISFLYQYWTEVPKLLKRYLVISAVVLMFITSLGIYGYLSSAYAKVAADPLRTNAEITVLNTQTQTLDNEITRRNERLNQLISLKQQQENRVDNLISKSTTGSNRTVRSAQQQVAQLDKNVTNIQNEITSLSKNRDSLKALVINKQVEINTNSDIGTFVYVANFIGLPLDTVVKWFILVIVLVFDPLSVSLVLAYNFLKKRQETPQATVSQTIPTFPPEHLSAKSIIGTNLPYYMQPGFDWEANKDKWQNDPEVLEYRRRFHKP